MNRIRYFCDKKHFGNTVSIYDNIGWYFIVIKDRSDYYYSAMSKDKKHYYNIDSYIRRKLGYGIIDSEIINQNIDLNLNNIHQTDVPDYIQLLMQTGSIYGEKIIRSYKPRRKKFEQQVEEYFKINQSVFCEVLRDVVYESIETNLLNRLPVFMFHRLY